MNVFVVPDAHGNADLVDGLLHQEGITSSIGTRIDTETRVVQLGDLCNCVASSIADDLVCLRRAPEWFDVYLVGNHEHPYFGGPRFGGYWPDPQIRELLRRYEARGLIRPCVAIDGVLISHAGLTSGRGRADTSADEFVRWAEAEWAGNKNGTLFSAIGQTRGGWTREGGILWADWSEPKRAAFSQIVGHTVGDDVRWRRRTGTFTVCLDLGAGKGHSRIAGAWLRDGEIEVVTYEQLAVAA